MRLNLHVLLVANSLFGDARNVETLVDHTNALNVVLLGHKKCGSHE